MGENLLINVTGWLGVIGLLIAYWLVSTKRLEGDSVTYQSLNAVGAVLLITNSFFYGAYPSVAINVVWIGIGVYALVRPWRKGNEKNSGAKMKYETRCVKIKLKPGSLERVREWAKTLNETRRDEAIATLRDETVVVESYFLDSTPEGDFLVAFMMAESFEKSREAVAVSTHEIDRYHQQFKKDTWENRQPLELIVDLDRIAEVTDQ